MGYTEEGEQEKWETLGDQKDYGNQGIYKSRRERGAGDSRREWVTGETTDTTVYTEKGEKETRRDSE